MTVYVRSTLRGCHGRYLKAYAVHVAVSDPGRRGLIQHRWVLWPIWRSMLKSLLNYLLELFDLIKEAAVVEGPICTVMSCVHNGGPLPGPHSPVHPTCCFLILTS